MPKLSFKFLEPYTKNDIDSFFGRSKESKDIYDMCFNSNLILIYGASGTGKTSIVQCGLAKEFKSVQRKEIIVRRNNNIINSLYTEVGKEIDKKVADMGVTKETDLRKAVLQLQKISFMPIYLIFDQFEELFIIKQGSEVEWKKEKEDFFLLVKELTNFQMFSICHVIFVIREEFIAHLWEFEKILPALFRYRYRIEGVRKDGLKFIVKKILDSSNITYENSVPDEIVEILGFNKGQIELTYLQVLLEHLRQNIENENESEFISLKNIFELGKLSDIIGDFIDKELKKLEEDFSEKRRELPMKLLGAMVSSERTKKVLSSSELESIRKAIGMNEYEYKNCISSFLKMKIIRQFED